MQEKIKKNFRGLKVLVAPLDWGLGHATRCIPIISALLDQKNEVWVGAEGKIATVIREAFPQIKIVPLKGYNVHYSRNKSFFFLKILAQLPKIYTAIQQERKWLKHFIEAHQFDVVISDNRLGLSIKEVHSVFITHQLSIQSGIQWLDKIIQKINYHYINQFNECWVPDVKGEQNIAGVLSHPVIMPDIPVEYIGLLSRFYKSNHNKKYQVVIVLSGPEPQRTIFENKLITQLKTFQQPVVLVRGLPNENNLLKLENPKVTIYNHLEAAKLSVVMQEASWVVARSGYSTIMDLLAIEQRAVLIPTPGQTEQLYLAQYLSKRKLFKSIAQEDFILENVVSDI